MKTKCLQCDEPAVLLCSWINTEHGKPPYLYRPFCDKHSTELYEKVKHSGFWINKPIEEAELDAQEKELKWLEKTGRI